ncbi:MAG: transposase [Planctomycetales bacterium]|nr:transposase [Planctomycetales bacterium]
MPPRPEIERLIERMRNYDDAQLLEISKAMQHIEKQRGRVWQPAKHHLSLSGESLHNKSWTTKDWPRAPLHRLTEGGTYMYTAATYKKQHYFRDTAALDFIESALLSTAEKYGWTLEAWAVFSNHYHFVGSNVDDPKSLECMTKALHSLTARWVNERDKVRRRKVWWNYWESLLTFQRSYLARLKYVHENAVRHGLVAVANEYPWCSASWFERTATPAQVKTIYGMQIDRITVVDDFTPEISW